MRGCFARRDEAALEAVAPEYVDVAVAMLAVHPVHVDLRPVALAELQQDGSIPAAQLEHADALPAGEPGVDFSEDPADAIDKLGVPSGAKGQLRPVLRVADHRRLAGHRLGLLRFCDHLPTVCVLWGTMETGRGPKRRWRGENTPFVCSIAKDPTRTRSRG
jgi:hypothetical protein